MPFIARFIRDEDGLAPGVSQFPLDEPGRGLFVSRRIGGREADQFAEQTPEVIGVQGGSSCHRLTSSAALKKSPAVGNCQFGSTKAKELTQWQGLPI
jgi:hypothetical protein